MSVWDLKLVEHDFAEAALDPARWVNALDTVTNVTKSHGALILPTAGSSLATLPYTERMAGPFETYLQDGWDSRDERHRGASRMMQCGVVDDLDLFNFEAILKHPYYQEFLAPHRLRWFAGVRISCGEDLWCLSIQRTIGQDPFSEAEKDQLAELSKTLSTSAVLAKALSASAAAGALETFELSASAVLLIDRHGKVFKANQSALQLLVGDVQLKNGRLVVKDAKAMLALNAAIHGLLGRRTGGLAAPVALPVTGRRPLLAYPAKLSSATANAFADCQAIIIIVDPEARLKPSEATLRSVFGLSRAEARLGAQLALGGSLESVAERLGIAKETSRSQLKTIFQKTQVHRQAELVAIFSTFLDSSEEGEPDNSQR